MAADRAALNYPSETSAGVGVVTTRRLPRVGEPVTVLYLSGPIDGVITKVTDDLHGLEVLTDDGASVQFRLNEATARFLSTGDDAAARLFFRSHDEPS